MAPMNVVLPTPRPPLTTIFTASGTILSERPDMVPDPFEHRERQLRGLLKQASCPATTRSEMSTLATPRGTPTRCATSATVVG